MADFNGYEDLQEHFANSMAIIDQLHEYESKDHHQQHIIKDMTQKIDTSNESEKKLLQQLKSLSNVSEDCISALYVKLEEQHADLQKKYTQQDQTIRDLQENHQKQIQTLKDTINAQNSKLIRTENLHCNELETQQASADLRFDDMQSRLQLQLNDATRRLQEANRSCNTLREELLIFKSRSVVNTDNANKRIRELERDLRLSQQQLQITQEKLYAVTKSKSLENYSHTENTYDINYNRRSTDLDFPRRHHNDKPSTNIINNKIVMYNNDPQQPLFKATKETSVTYTSTSNKYHPLNQEASSSKELPETTDNINILEYPQNRRYVGGSLQKDEHRLNKPYVPPLRPLSKAKQNPKSCMKKRKLYNPDNLDYFENYEEKE